MAERTPKPIAAKILSIEKSQRGEYIITGRCEKTKVRYKQTYSGSSRSVVYQPLFEQVSYLMID